MNRRKQIEKTFGQITFWLIALVFLGSYPQFELPPQISEIPISLQSFIVLLIGYFTRPPLAFTILIIYVALAFLGVPVLTDGTTGLILFTKGSFGYLIGFIVGAPILSSLLAVNKGNMKHILLAFILATAIILFFGWFHLSFKIGMLQALEKGVIPFLPGALVKLCLAMGFVWLWEYKTRDKSQFG